MESDYVIRLFRKFNFLTFFNILDFFIPYIIVIFTYLKIQTKTYIMETLEKKEVIATLVAEAITDVVFDVNTSRYGRTLSNHKVPEMNIVGDYRGTIGVKIGNAVKELKFKIARDYISSEGDYGTETYVEGHYTPYEPTLVSDTQLHTLTEAGIEVDLSKVEEVYAEEVKRVRVVQRVTKEADKLAGEKKRENEYDTRSLWFFKFIQEVANSNNKKVSEKAFKLEPMPREGYVKNEPQTFAMITYRKIVTHIKMEDGRFVYTDGYDEKPDSKGNRQTRYISGSKQRRTKNASSAALKFMTEVDEYLETIAYRKKNQNDANNKRDEINELLCEVTGYPVNSKEETKYQQRMYGGRGGDSYKVTTHKIVTEFSKYSYGDDKGFTLTTDVNYSTKVRTFGVNGIKGLNKEQLKSILDIVLKGVQLPTKPEKQED